ncbi:hypothetical protein TrispH2_008808 [Trichoplax sp. H2]|nr:hypothetical protein TrispH2_008808 [Trichoplax sp. H2]|eukprot:RDD39937.1 hypothetical protein TrispH2_008808 [Trichoplax sp. H2]
MDRCWLYARSILGWTTCRSTKECPLYLQGVYDSSSQHGLLDQHGHDDEKRIKAAFCPLRWCDLGRILHTMAVVAMLTGQLHSYPQADVSAKAKERKCFLTLIDRCCWCWEKIQHASWVQKQNQGLQHAKLVWSSFSSQQAIRGVPVQPWSTLANVLTERHLKELPTTTTAY